MTDTEPSDVELRKLYEVAHADLLQVVAQGDRDGPRVAWERLMMMAVTFPEWEVSSTTSGGARSWQAQFRHDVTEQMREAGAATTLEAPDLPNLIRALAEQMPLVWDSLGRGEP